MFRLRKIQLKDLALIMEWRMSEEVTKYMYTDPILTLEGQIKWLEYINRNKKNMKYWIIEVDDKAVGVMSINNIDLINKKASWAYYLGDISARGKGLARILECNIYDYVFEKLNLNKLYCEVFEFNESVIKIHEKFGSKIEGKFIDHIKKGDNYYNVISMAIIKQEWLSKRGAEIYKPLEIQEY